MGLASGSVTMLKRGMLPEGRHKKIPDRPSPILPTSECSYHSTSTSSRSRPNWADLTDDCDSSDDHWTPTSSLPPVSVRSLPTKSAFGSSSDDPGEAYRGEIVAERSWPSRHGRLGRSGELSEVQSISHRSTGSHHIKSSASDRSTPRPSFPGPLNVADRDDSESVTERNAESKSAAAAQLLSKSLTPADDARFWSNAASNATASSGSESTQRSGRPAEWSAGAELHASGQCHPCIFFPKAVGCENGIDCTFCHLAHESRARHRRHMRRGRGNRLNAEYNSEVSQDTDSKPSEEFEVPTPTNYHGKAAGKSAGYPGKSRQRTNPQEKNFALKSALNRLESPWPRWSALQEEPQKEEARWNQPA